MAELEQADTRIQLICDKIRAETLDPAKEQAQEIIENARREADRILQHAHGERERILSETKKLLDEEKQIFESSLKQASKQSIELLKQKIETTLFNPSLETWVKEHMGNAKSYASLVEALVKALNKEGIKTELGVLIPQTFTTESINSELTQDVLQQLKNRSVQLSDLPAGVQVKIAGKNMVLDISGMALQDIIASYIHKDFRKIFFGSE